jgi:hypothetical protein
MLLSDLGKKINNAQLSTQNTLIDLFERMDRMEKGKTVNTAYSTKDLTPSSAAPTSTVNVKFGMPPNYFAGQTPPPGTVRPTTAEPARPVASTGQTAASAAGAVRPVPQTGQTTAMVLASASTPTLAQFRVRLLLAERMNWRDLYRRIQPDHTANHIFHPQCHRIFGMI